MNRDIKFRYFDKYSNKLFYFRLNSYWCIWEDRSHTKRSVKQSIEPSGHDCQTILNIFSIMQYTGLKDKNGVEIYEGDIYFINKDFKTKDGGYLTENKYLEVVFRKAQFVNKELNKDIFSSLVMMVDYEAGEVIGNIYENPELLNSIKDNKKDPIPNADKSE